MGESDQCTGAGVFGRWWELLPVRLALAINLAAILVLSVFGVWDYRQTRSRYYAEQADRLQEEAKVLRAAQAHFGDPGQFQQFVDTFCQQMDVAASPGHHIAVFDSAGRLRVRAHQRDGALLESSMVENRDRPHARLRVNGTEYVSVSIPGAKETSVIVAQSLAPIRQIIVAQAVRRAISLGILALVILSVTGVLVYIWVHRPLYALVRGLRAIGGGAFDIRVSPSGSAELRYLANGLNDVAIDLERVDRDRKQQLKRARGIQTRLLPRSGRRAGPYRIDAAFQPAESVGGDFYDLIELADGSLLVAILDVSGHGVAAALHTALLRTVLRYESSSNADPAAVLAAMNREFATVVDSGEFATGCIVRLYPDHRLQYASAGHDAAVIVTPHLEPRFLDEGGLALGILPEERYFAGKSHLESGSSLYLYTDGLHEFACEDGSLFGRERLVQLLVDSREDPQQVTERLRELSSTGAFEDDVTLVRVQAQ